MVERTGAYCVFLAKRATLTCGAAEGNSVHGFSPIRWLDSILVEF